MRLTSSLRDEVASRPGALRRMFTVLVGKTSDTSVSSPVSGKPTEKWSQYRPLAKGEKMSVVRLNPELSSSCSKHVESKSMMESPVGRLVERKAQNATIALELH